MTFLTPIYLLLLLPWAGVVAWVLLGRAEFSRVSTTMFWEKNETSTQTRRGIRKPPVWAVLMLLAMLAAIGAASGLAYYGEGARVRWVVDRGLLTMAALQNDPAMRERIDRSRAIPVPDSTDLFRAAAIDTSGGLRQTVKRLLSETGEPIVVVTSQAITLDDPRVTIMRPAHAVRNAGIDHFAVAIEPRPQAMVRVWNGTDAQQATLRVDGATRSIDLPPAGESRDYFVDLESPGEVIEAVLEIDDDIDADDQAWLTRSRATPRLTPAPGLGEAVGRFVAIYDRTRGPVADAPTISITDDPRAEPPAIVLRGGTSNLAGDIRAADHPVNRWIDWDDIAPLLRRTIADSPPRGEPIVWIGDRPIVAVEAGRVEIGFEVGTLASRPELVLLLSNAAEHVAGGRSAYASVAPGMLGPGWDVVSRSADVDGSPGVYQEKTERRAVSMRAVRPPTGDPAPNPPPPAGGREVVSLTRPLLVVSLAGVLGGLFCLTPSRRRVR